MRTSLKSLAIAFLTIMCVAQLSHAHRFYAAFTQIDYRPQKQTIEVVHRLFTHDVEDYLKVTFGNRSAALTDEEIEPALQEFVERAFALFDSQGTRLPLTWIGMEYATDNVYLYQEAPLPADPSELFLINRLFMDLFEDQKNTVNVEWGEKIRTRIFRKDDEQQKVSFIEED